jgi:hypothetical protein
MHQTDLTVLVEYPESISFGLEDDTDALRAGEQGQESDT